MVLFGLWKKNRSGILHPRPVFPSCVDASGEPCSSEFHKGSEFFGKHSDYFTADIQLELYGLYKQATRGDCPADMAASTSGTRRTLMTHAWLSKTGMSSKSAQETYVRTLDLHYPQWRNASGILEEDDEEDPFVRNTEDNNEDQRYRAQYKQLSNWASGSVPAGVIGTESDRDESVGGLLCEMASTGNADAIKEILGKNPSLVDVRDKEGMTCLHWAADRGHVSIIQYLVSLGANVNLVDDCGNSPLHISAMAGQKEAVRLLLDAGADTTVVNCEGEAVIDLLRSEFPRIVFS